LQYVQQISAFAGDGKLVDGGTASQELRDFPAHAPSPLLTRYPNERLTDPFADSGFGTPGRGEPNRKATREEAWAAWLAPTSGGQ
jgi:hypothetical protein